MIGVVYALAAALVAAVGGLIGFGIAALSARKEAGNEKARHAELAVRLEAAVANAKTEAARADFERGRADALDAAIVDAAVAGPVDGSFERLLQVSKATRAAGGAGAGELHQPSDGGEPAPALGPDDLLPPGA